MKKRVVVTGLGIVSPLGIGVEECWQALCAGKSGVEAITLFDPAPLKTRIAGEVKNFDPAKFMEKKVVRRMDRFVQFAIAAASMAAEHLRVAPLADPVDGQWQGLDARLAIGIRMDPERFHERSRVGDRSRQRT